MKIKLLTYIFTVLTGALLVVQPQVFDVRLLIELVGIVLTAAAVYWRAMLRITHIEENHNLRITALEKEQADFHREIVGKLDKQSADLGEIRLLIARKLQV